MKLTDADRDLLSDAFVKKMAALLDPDDPELLKKTLMMSIEDTELTLNGTVSVKEWEAFLNDEIIAEEEDDEVELGTLDVIVICLVILFAAYGTFVLAHTLWMHAS